MPRDWTRDEVLAFRKAYPSRPDPVVAQAFGRTQEEVRELAGRLALAKDKAIFPGIAKVPRWTPAELALLRDWFPTRSNLEIALDLGRSMKSVISKAFVLGLKKSAGRLRDMGRENAGGRRPSPGKATAL